MKRLAIITDKEKGIVNFATTEDLNDPYFLERGFEPMDIDERLFNGAYYLEGMRPEEPEPTFEKVEELRQRAYEREVDGKYTAHISRLRDEEQTPEVVAEIERLIEERRVIVADIKERYPYPEESKKNGAK